MSSLRVLAITNMYPTAAFPGRGVFIEQQVAGLRAIGLEVEVLFIDRRAEGARVYYRMGPQIEQALERFDPDLIHVMYGGVMADQVVRHHHSRPVVITFHGSDLLGENLSGPVRKMVSHYGVHCSRRAAREAEGVIVVARHLLKALHGTVEPRLVRVIPCGIDLDRFQPQDRQACRNQLGWKAGVFHVLFASSSGDPVKRPALAQAAVARLQECGVEVELHWLSGVPYAQVPLWLNAADALLLTSLHEGSPTIVKEALACALPVVSVDVGDVAERLSGVEGCFLAQAEPGDLARQLERVRRHGQRLRGERHLQELSHLHVAYRIKEFYQELVSIQAWKAAGPRLKVAS